MSLKILTFITVYNDYLSAKKLTTVLLNQTIPIDQILVIDNSPKQVYFSDFEKVKIFHFPKNIGTAGALDLALKIGREASFDFLWAFDQDSMISDNLLENLLKEFHLLNHRGINPSVIAPTGINIHNNSLIYGLDFNCGNLKINQNTFLENYSQPDVTILSCSLIHLSSTSTFLKPNVNYFLDYVDYDFFLKLKKKGGSLIICRHLNFYHKLGNVQIIKESKTSEESIIWTASPLRYYNSSKNFSHLILTHNELRNPIYSWRIIFNSFKDKVIHIRKYESNKISIKILACTLGTLLGSLRLVQFNFKSIFKN